MNMLPNIAAIAADRPLGIVTFRDDYAPRRRTVMTIYPEPFTFDGFQEASRTSRVGHDARNVGIGVVAGDELIGSIAYWHQGDEPWVDALSEIKGG